MAELDNQEPVLDETEVPKVEQEPVDQGASSDAGEDTPKEDQWAVPGRFKTQDDLYKSYRELESEFGRRSNELHRLKQQANAQPVDPKRRVEEFAEDVKRDPVEAIKKVMQPEIDAAKSEAKRVRFESEYARRMANSEFAELEPAMTQIAEAYGDMIITNGMQNDPKLLDILYLAAKGLKQDRITKDAEAKGKKAGEAAANKKSKAQIEGSSGTQGTVKKKFDELSLDEMKKRIEAGDLG